MEVLITASQARGLARRVPSDVLTLRLRVRPGCTGRQLSLLAREMLGLSGIRLIQAQGFWVRQVQMLDHHILAERINCSVVRILAEPRATSETGDEQEVQDA